MVIPKGSFRCVVGYSSIIFPLSGCLLSRGEYAEWKEVLRVTLVCIEGGICVLSSCIILVSLMMTLEGKLLWK